MLQIPLKRFRHTAALLVVICFICSGNAVAIPIENYQQRLHEAIESLAEFDQIEDDNYTELGLEFVATIENVRTSLPARETVEFGTDVYEVDNSSLHKALDALKQTSGADRARKLEQLLLILEALEQRVLERQQPGVPMENKEQAKAKLESILARPEYVSQAKGPNALTRVLQDFFRWLQKLLPKPKSPQSGGPGWLTQVAQIIVLLIAFFVIGYVIKILLTRFKRSGKIKTSKKPEPRIVLGERLEPEETATDLLSEAEALALRGELRAAIRKAYIALLVELGDRKLISLAQHKTNRDYLNSLRNLPPLHSRMRGLTESFERHWYGFAEATPNDWQDFRAGYLAALHSKN